MNVVEKFIPDIYQKSIYDINYKNLKKRKIKCLCFDLDNTLVPYTETVPTSDIKELFHLLSADFKVIILSNSGKKRLTPFKEILNVDVAYSSRKPFKKKYLKIMNTYGYKPEEIACVGDQIMTDIFGANRNGCVSILVNPMGSKEPATTKFNRFWEKMILKRLAKKSILVRGKYYE
ncbi:MAG: YqeG family HAD IIIA-type phosphatase [Firmicutes bacterium]|nr:YqeG family HAD IIIA-type phosphatase [Bacillota bacterium]